MTCAAPRNTTKDHGMTKISKTRKTSKNTLFPGRYNYTGPTKGWFAFLHHEQLCEESHDVNERLDYVKRQKPKNEVAIRLHNMIYLGGCEAIAKLAPLDADYEAKLAALDADYKAKRAPLYADYKAKCAPLDAEILAYIKANIPDCAWNGRTLVFP
jgi:hypothetical protein